MTRERNLGKGMCIALAAILCAGGLATAASAVAAAKAKPLRVGRMTIVSSDHRDLRQSTQAEQNAGPALAGFSLGMSFGAHPNALQGEFTTQSLSLTNEGPGDLGFVTQTGEAAKGVLLTGDSVFSVVSADTATTLTAGQSADIVLKFAPTSNGNTAYTGTLKVFTTDPGSPLVVKLSAISLPVHLSRFEIE